MSVKKLISLMCVLVYCQSAIWVANVNADCSLCSDFQIANGTNQEVCFCVEFCDGQSQTVCVPANSSINGFIGDPCCIVSIQVECTGIEYQRGAVDPNHPLGPVDFACCAFNLNIT